MSDIAWSIRGNHFVNCNCDYGCPCQFNALPTDGTCRAVLAWHIEEGHFGDVRLDGLMAVNTYGWPPFTWAMARCSPSSTSAPQPTSGGRLAQSLAGDGRGAARFWSKTTPRRHP